MYCTVVSFQILHYMSYNALLIGVFWGGHCGRFKSKNVKHIFGEKVILIDPCKNVHYLEYNVKHITCVQLGLLTLFL